MSILFFLLKIIGILILIPIVGALILLILPIAYRAEGDFDGKNPWVKAKVTWAFIFFRMKVVYDGELHIMARIFGIPLYRSEQDKWSLLGNDGKNPVKEDIIYEKSTQKDNEEKQKTTITEPKLLEKEPKQEEKPKGPIEDVFDLEWNESDEDTEARVEDGQQIREQKKSFYKKIVDFFQKCYNKCKRVIKTFSAFFQKAEAIADLLQDDEILAAISRVKGYGLQGFRYILPKKVKGNLVFGFEDPAATGKTLAFLGMAFPFYGECLQVTGDFTKSTLKGHILITGRIRRYRILKLVWTVYRDKDLMRQKDRVTEIIGG